MTDLEAIRAYWSYADAQEGALLSYIDNELDSLSDEIQGILDRFQRIELSGRLSKSQVETLHRKIKQWKGAGFTDAYDMKMYLRDLENRSRIKGSEALFIWLFAAMMGGYKAIAKKTEITFLTIAQHIYKREFDTAQKMTQAGTMKPIKTIPPLLSQTQPDGDSFYTGLYNDAEYRAQRIEKITAAQKQQDIVLDIGGVDYQKALQAQKAWMLRPAKSSAGQPNNYAGYIDMTMSFIVGHTVAQAFIDAGVKKYQFIATVDGWTTDACRSLNRKIFDMKDLKLGINAPPVYPPPHPCRSIIRAIK